MRFPACDSTVVEKLAQLRLIETCVRDSAEAAVAAYAEIAGAHARAIDAVTLTAFQFLSGFGYRAAAIKLGEWRLARDPRQHNADLSSRRFAQRIACPRAR